MEHYSDKEKDMATKKTETAAPEVLKIETQELNLCIIGNSPLIHNAISERSMRELLFPAPKKNAAEKASSLKHDPIAEFRSSAHRVKGGPTLVGIPATAFKGALMTAALDLPGISKASIGRLVFVAGDLIPVWGVPEVLSTTVRSADMAKTPDVRTRAIMREWATKIRVKFVSPLLKQPPMINLVSAAGITIGVGDWRPEKGKGSYGQFSICNPDDPDFLRIIQSGGRDAQQAAFDNPVAYDLTTEELLDWFNRTAAARGFKVAA
jgi:hypothetical protein